MLCNYKCIKKVLFFIYFFFLINNCVEFVNFISTLTKSFKKQKERKEKKRKEKKRKEKKEVNKNNMCEILTVLYEGTSKMKKKKYGCHPAH